MDLLQKAYSHFIVDQPLLEDRVPFNVAFYSGQDGNSNQPYFMINGEKKQFTNPKLYRSEYIHALFLSLLCSNVVSYYLHHAAALSINGKGIILTADSGYGKTTLTLALVQRGFRFLSDEIAVLGRKDGLVYPFPRGLNIREQTLDLLDIPFSIKKASRWFGKYLFDIEDIFPGMISEPAKISCIFVLKSSNNTKTAAENHHEFRAIVSHITPAFLENLNADLEISPVQVSEDQGFPQLLIQSDHRIKVIPAFEDVCRQHGIMILDLIKREDDIPDFSPQVQYQKISKSQAALELLRRFLGGNKTALLNGENHQDSIGLLMELVTLIQNADCYQITIGPLQQMVEVISDLVGNGSNIN